VIGNLPARIMRPILFTLAILLMVACAPAPRTAVIGPDGTLKVLGPQPEFTEALKNGVWIPEGDLNSGQLSIVEEDGVRALLVHGSNRGFSLARQLNARLLATPFLEWSWKVSTTTTPFHQTSLLVGFTAPPDAPPHDQPDMVPHIPATFGANRFLSIRWSNSALTRGHLRLADEQIDVPVYIARGGAENTGRWWREGIELSTPYSQLWPGEDMSRVKIAFLAIVAGTGHERTDIHFADIDLFR
jgi:hypothetical protein